jgi:amidase
LLREARWRTLAGMISQAEYTRLDAVALAQLVQRREVSASELLEAAIARAELTNPRLNAIVTPMHQHAHTRAKGVLTGPLAGVPFLIKDWLQDFAGVPSSGGNAARKRALTTPREHGEIVRRFLTAGLVIFGRTNTPEFGAKGITEPLAWGATHNPWQLEHSPGGSSGGSAAAVAAGIVPIAGANDGGGSIRIPASYCGLFGFKPGRGRTPSGPPHSELMHGAAINHVLTRSVRDSALMLDATHGSELGSWAELAAPERPYLDEVARDPTRLRIGFCARSPLDTPVSREAANSVEDAARLLASLGHLVEPAQPEIDGARLASDFLRMWFAHMAVLVDETRALTDGADAEFELDTLAMAAIGRHMRATEYVASHQRWNEYLRALAVFHSHYDVYMTPTTASAAPRIGEVETPAWLSVILRGVLALGASKLLAKASAMIDDVARDNLGRVPFTQLANLTGVPAMSVPLHTCASGLPLGVQFVAPHGREGMLFSLAGQLERAAPWSERAPAL